MKRKNKINYCYNCKDKTYWIDYEKKVRRRIIVYRDSKIKRYNEDLAIFEKGLGAEPKPLELKPLKEVTERTLNREHLDFEDRKILCKYCDSKECKCFECRILLERGRRRLCPTCGNRHGITRLYNNKKYCLKCYALLNN